MAQGLRTVVMTVAAGKTRKLTLRGVFLYVKETSFPMMIALRQNDIGEKSGLVFENEMRKGEKIYSATEFDKIEVTNSTASEVTVTLVCGFGDFARELPERVSAADFTRTTRVTLAGTAGGEALIAEEQFRKKLFIRADDGNNVAGVRLSESLAQIVAGNALPLFPLESVPYEVKNALFAEGTAGDILYVVEEVYND